MKTLGTVSISLYLNICPTKRLREVLFKETLIKELNLQSFLPNLKSVNKMGYYRYSGSISTPPCTEGILWNVFETKIDISPSQVNKHER